MAKKTFLTITMTLILIGLTCLSANAKDGSLLQRTDMKGVIPDAMDRAAFEKSHEEMEERIGMLNDIESHSYTVYDVFDDIEMPQIEEPEREVALLAGAEFNTALTTAPLEPSMKIEKETVYTLPKTNTTTGDEVVLSPFLESRSKYGAFSLMSLQQELIREGVIYPVEEEAAYLADRK
jgi:hypothetical protein